MVAKLAVLVAVLSCAGDPPRATTPPPTVASETPPPPPSAQPQSDTLKVTAVPVDESYDDPNEHPGTQPLEVEITKGTPKSAYPKRTAGDRDCWQHTAITGDAERDYATLVGKCGAATGLMEYAKPVSGKLHSSKDKRDSYSLKLLGGLCYRFFAVGGGSIKDIDVLVQKPGGALVADDKSTQPVAIITSDGPWCMDADITYEFHVEVDGPGTGGYTFGVWARPK